MTSAARPAIRVLIIDDSALVRGGLRQVFSTQSHVADITVAGEADSVSSGIAAAARLQPDVVLLDIRLPDGSGLTACREILRQDPKACVLVLTSYVDDKVVYDSVVAGAQGYLLKEIEPTNLIEAVVAGAEGRAMFPSELAARVMRLLRAQTPSGDALNLALLSAQELRVLALVVEGCTNKEVGNRLGLSENTVKNYLGNVFEKLKVKRRAQAVAIYTSARLPVE